MREFRPQYRRITRLSPFFVYKQHKSEVRKWYLDTQKRCQIKSSYAGQVLSRFQHPFAFECLTNSNIWTIKSEGSNPKTLLLSSIEFAIVMLESNEVDMSNVVLRFININYIINYSSSES
jgi:hypothetical protein